MQLKGNYSAPWHAVQKLDFCIRPCFFKEKSERQGKKFGNGLGTRPLRSRGCKQSPASVRPPGATPRAPRTPPCSGQQTRGPCSASTPNSVLPGTPRLGALRRPPPGLASAVPQPRRPAVPPTRPPARSQLSGAGAAPAARRPLAGCHVTLRGNQELRGAAGGRGRRRVGRGGERVRRGGDTATPGRGGRGPGPPGLRSPRPARGWAGQAGPVRRPRPRGPGPRVALEAGGRAVGTRGALTSNMSPRRKTIATQETMSA